MATSKSSGLKLAVNPPNDTPVAMADAKRAARKPAAPVLRMVAASECVSHDTVKTLEVLLDEARRGEIIGVAFAAMLRDRKFIVDSAGEAYKNPTFSLGMVRMLEEELMQRVLCF